MERAIVMTGIGGQGIQLIAKLLAQAGMREGRQVMMFGIFKGTIRGGSSESTVVLADGEIVSPPIVPHVWAVLAMHGGDLPPLAERLKPGGVLVVNANLVPKPPAPDGVRVVSVPAGDLAKAAGAPLGASMVALGALAGATGVARVESLVAALGDVLPPHRRKQIDANRACLEAGAVHTTGSPAAAAAWA
jgi:Pyruvate/2-oxoacid:ferredoxin oxidoreductase gamma subunit